MDRLTSTLRLALGWMVIGLAGTALAQDKLPPAPGAGTGAPAGTSAGQAPAAAPAPLKLYSLDSATQADPFPPVNPKYFTADAPSVSTVESYLKTMLGFDPNRIWRVMGIQKTAAPGVSKVSVLISQRGAGAKVASATFYVLPDGKHLISNDAAGVSPFGAEPFAANRATLLARADGPARGAASKDLLLVEFADLQCPHCKEAQATIEKLQRDFPKARFVFQNFPLVDVHPYAFQAAEYGVCVAKQSNDAFFTYAQAVYDTQSALVPDTAEQTLKAAATKAGADSAAIAACAASDATKAQVDASVRLAQDVGVDQTPMLAVNGRLLAITAIPYDTLKSLIIYQANLDGVSATVPGFDLKTH